MRLHFYDVAQGLAVLVDLPDGRHILVDTGDVSNRTGCGAPCKVAHDHLMTALKGDLQNSRIDMLWITHQHSDHLGGAVDVLENIKVATYVDNGRDLDKPQIKKARATAAAHHVDTVIVDPDHAAVPLKGNAGVKVTAVVPPQWPSTCAGDANDCSIGLRIDYCSSSVLLTGDEETPEEAQVDPGGAVTLLQLAHHGSNTSSSAALLQKAAPKYAVISSGKPGEGMNKTYCHPSLSTVERVSTLLAGDQGEPLAVFDDAQIKCNKSTPANWKKIKVSARMWATSRDGDVILMTKGDGEFSRQP